MRGARPPRAVLAAAAAAVALLTAAPAGASEYSKSLARKVQREVVYVDPKAKPAVSTADAGKIRLRILRKAIGRIKIAVVPERRAVREGGATGLGTAVARDLDFRGALMIVAGSTVFTLTTHPESQRTVAEVTEAFNRNEGDRAKQLLAAVDGIAAVDPGPSADQGRPAGAGGGGGFAEGTDFGEEVSDAIQLTTVIIAVSVGLPFVVIAILIAMRVRRGRREREEDWEFAQEGLRNELIALGDEIRALDVDASMPGVNQLGVADYNAAVEQYDRANTALQRCDENPRLWIAEARAALKEGQRRMSDAKVRLGVTPIP